MKVWVVVSDYGLNGFSVHGVYTTRPSDKDVDRFTGTEQVVDEGSRKWYFHPASTTGYQGTEIIEIEVDRPLQ